MALADFLQQLDQLAAEANTAFEAAADADSLEAARVEFLGAKAGRLKAVQKLMGSVPGPEKPAAGKRLNEVKDEIQAAFQTCRDRLGTQPAKGKSAEQFDATLPGRPIRLGRLHPITQTIEELKDIMGRLGFSVAEGPEVEDQRHNFEALNIPQEHPARDPLENFYLATAQGTLPEPLLLRSQT
ncbi:MAG: phenylalanine--tRNA ligase subunit alpha, partial [Planctomycetales bacterium]|nr:phenylalanine--tRNA ligase subunit alpha [Planctomycetales bacterium]